MVFRGSSHPLRTTEEYHNRINKTHHTLEQCFLDQVFSSLVNDVPFEYMHLILLGVTKKLFSIWLLGSYKKMQS